MPNNANAKGSIFIISSQVVSGQVGLKAAQPALRSLGYEAVTLPTTLLAAHPAAFAHHGAPAGGAVPADEVLALADWLLATDALDKCAAILTGYMPTPAHIEVAAQIITKMKTRKPELVYCCDPICGDNGQLYLPEDVMHGLRDNLLPMADMATPNLFELQMLTGAKDFADEAEIVKAARSLAVKQVLVTSAPAAKERIATLAVETAKEGDTLRCETAKAPHAPHGMGDFFAALYLGLKLDGEPKALGIACATMAQMAASNLAATSLPYGPIELAAAAIQDRLAL